MQTVGNVARRLVPNTNRSDSPPNRSSDYANGSASGPNSGNTRLYELRRGYDCPDCKDAGYVYKRAHDGSATLQVVPCDCRSGINAERRRERLERISGLRAKELRLRFDDLTPGFHDEARERVRYFVGRRRGIVTLTGAPGLGKSALLICAVNEARSHNIPAVYSKLTDLLDYLKQAYNPSNTGLTFDSRWELLVNAEVLALDELDEFNATPWAFERFCNLIDERWRRMDDRLTLLATNSAINALPDKVASRVRDGRGEVIEMRGADMRPYQVWEAGE